MDPWRIDVHAHPLPQFYIDAVTEAKITRSRGKPYPDWSEAALLRIMDDNGILTSMMSFSTPHVNFGAPAKAIDLARRCNDYTAQLVDRYRGRFGTLAVLPLPDVEAACREAVHGLDTMGADGVTLLASYGETFLGDAVFDPLFAELDRRAAVVLVHPTQHPEAAGLKLDLPLFVAEYTVNTMRAALNLITKDVLRRFPKIRFILSHGGGVLPYIAWRLATPRVPAVFQMDPLEALRLFWYDIALAAGRQSLATLREVADPTRILFGCDWPYTRDATVALTVQDFTAIPFLSPEQKRAIEVENSLLLFPRLRANYA